MPSAGLNLIAVISLTSAVICALAILVDIRVRGYRQPMAVMEWVWPITALYLGVFGLAFYVWAGRRSSEKYREAHGDPDLPYWARVGVASTHCGGGCTLGDIVAETLVAVFGLTIFGVSLFASYALDYTFALALGIAFQYAAIRAMSSGSRSSIVKRAAKADVWSLTAFEVGLFTWMALMFFVFFPDPHLSPSEPTYWFLMQIGMAIGLLTSYPMNLLLIRRGIKHVM